MKKLSVLFSFLIFSISLCFADTFNSNILMQKLPADIESDYVLSVSGNEELLYKDDVLLKKRITTESDGFDELEKTIEIYNYKEDSVDYYKYTNGLLKYYKHTINGFITEKFYTYDENNSLIFVSQQNADCDPDVTLYIRDTNTGKLIGTKNENSARWTDSDYLVEDDLILTEISNGLYLENDFSVNENNTISYAKNGVEYSYSIDGRILIETGSDYTINYNYDNELNLVSSETLQDDSTTVTEYENGVRTSSKVYRSNLLVESNVYKENGLLKTLYSNEKPVAEILYGKDNMKVLDIRYLN